jgi:hypothetical protein
MNWFRANRWLGTFVIIFAVATLFAVYFLFRAKGAFNEASARFKDAAAERSRLEHLDPFPNEANYRKMKGYLADYGAGLNKLKAELKTQMLPQPAGLAPNEFQSRLRQAMTETAQKARTNRVKLPDNFHLGFDEFTAALPNTAAAPLLGQELAQMELLMKYLIEARVDAVTALKRTPLPEEKSAAAGTAPTPPPGRKPATPVATGPKMLERGIVDLAFTSSPSAARKVLNQIASSNEQFYIIRTLHVRNQQEKGPPRDQNAGAGATNAAETASNAAGVTTTAKPTPSGAIKFIVGNEHVETSARIELVRFTF